MANQLPDDILEIIGGLTAEQEKQVVNRWLQNEKHMVDYSNNYISQRANLVQGNRKFGEVKSIFTPDKEAQRLHEELLAQAKAFAKENEEKQNNATGNKQDQAAVNDNIPEQGRDEKLRQFRDNHEEEKPKAKDNPNVISEQDKKRIQEETERKLAQMREAKSLTKRKNWGR